MMIEPPKMVIKQERMLFKLRNTGWLVNCDQRLSRNINHGMLRIVFVLKKSRLGSTGRPQPPRDGVATCCGWNHIKMVPPRYKLVYKPH